MLYPTLVWGLEFDYRIYHTRCITEFTWFEVEIIKHCWMSRDIIIVFMDLEQKSGTFGVSPPERNLGVDLTRGPWPRGMSALVSTSEVWRQQHSLVSVHALPTKRHVFSLQLCSGKTDGLFSLVYVIGLVLTSVTVQSSRESQFHREFISYVYMEWQKIKAIAKMERVKYFIISS